MIIMCAMQIGNLKGESGGAVATQQHLQRRRKNLIKVLDNVKVPHAFPLCLLTCCQAHLPDTGWACLMQRIMPAWLCVVGFEIWREFVPRR